MRHLVLGLVLLGGGCTLYPFDGEDDDPCEQRDIAQPAPERKVNPQTLTCQEFASGGPCAETCGPCTAGAPWNPPWGQCESACTDLDEAACRTTASCRIAHDSDRFDLGQDSFEGCFEISTNFGTNPTIACDTYDAEQCAQHDICAGVYEMFDGAPPSNAPRGEFVRCIAEELVSGTSGG